MERENERERETMKERKCEGETEKVRDYKGGGGDFQHMSFLVNLTHLWTCT